MSKVQVMEAIEKMSIEEKLAMLSEMDKAYLMGFVDRAAVEVRMNIKKNETNLQALHYNNDEELS
ncbi:MAG: hypothetical protein LBH44_13820 [Treponema sp.]|nr:hypothetical protein [Treponema sp.]